MPGRAELARRLQASERTVRNDITRLRGLGYPVPATTGITGGYRLAAGAVLPPLPLDGDGTARAGQLEQVLPNAPNGPAVDGATLATLAATCRDSQTVRLEYRGHAGTETLRTVQPHRLVHNGRRWFLVPWDTDRNDWRTFRVDRMRLRSPTGPRFTPREVSTPRSSHG